MRGCLSILVTRFNPKLADRLGVVYTPNEIVRFMIESTEALIHQHFGKLLISRGVEILDPATGTGTFITDLIEHFKHNPAELKYKYQNELHCNEVAILPYYIANLNIEFTYSQIMNEYAEFPHICFVDTLDNLGFKQTHKGGTDDLFSAGMTAVNTERVKAQNAKKISVIIGNPPYNANQLNENDNNKNRTYEGVDKRIKATYIAESTAQKTKVYDMYARFLRWASDRLDENGVVAFITNRSFIDSRTFDGFRKIVGQEFNEVCIVDLGGDVRANPKLSGTTHNVFGIQTGVAISFLVKNAKLNPPPQPSPAGGGSHVCRIRYLRRPEMETAEEKLSFLANSKLNDLAFQAITPDKNHNWINLSDNDFDSLIPVANKDTKDGKTNLSDSALFNQYSMGVVTARDDWVYDFNQKNLKKKIVYLISAFNSQQQKKRSNNSLDEKLDNSIKWSETLKRNLTISTGIEYQDNLIKIANYRPFIKSFYYSEKILSDRLTSLHYEMFGGDLQKENCLITIMGDSSGKPYFSLAINKIPDLNFVSPASGGTRCFALYRYDESGNRTDNITDWGLAQFKAHYQNSLPQRGRAGVGEELKPFNPPPLPATTLAYARALRANMTDAETKLWQALRREQLGVKFRKQHPISPFILDFYCVEKKLAIELDGGQHGDADMANYDAKRKAWLEAQGIRVVRFWNNEVLGNVDGVLQVVAEVIKLPLLEGLPHPSPPPLGEGVSSKSLEGVYKSQSWIFFTMFMRCCTTQFIAKNMRLI